MMKNFAALQIAAAVLGSAWILPACAAAPTKAQPKAQATKAQATKAQATKAQATKAAKAKAARAKAQQARLAAQRARETAQARTALAQSSAAQAKLARAKAELDASAQAAKPQPAAATETKEKKPVPPVLNFTMKSLAGKDIDLSQYAGQAILIVNTASKCGNTPQYEGLEKVYEKYKGQGLVILGFPSNDFAGQEPGSDEDIATFCKQNFGVSFPMFSKVQVKGEGKTPLYEFLTSEKTNPASPGEIDWNFAKFLIDRDGNIAARFKAGVQPQAPEITAAIEKALAPATE